MAFYFNNASSNRITLADNEAFTMVKSDHWTFLIWVKSDDRTGTIERPVFNWTAYGATTNWYSVSVGDASSASRADDIRFLSQDDDGTTINMESSSNPFASNTAWTSIIFVHNGDSVVGHVNGSYVGYGTQSAYDDLNRSGSVKLGNGIFDNQNWKGSLAEFAYWKRALSDPEIASLGGKGLSPAHFRHKLSVYFPMIREYVEVINNIAVTNNGTTVSTHPPIVYPSYTIIGKSAGSQSLTAPSAIQLLTAYSPTLLVQQFLVVGTAPNLLTAYTPSLVYDQTLVAPAVELLTAYTPTVTKVDYITVPATELLTVFNPTLYINETLVMPASQLLTVYNPSLYTITYLTMPAPIQLLGTYAPTLIAQSPLSMPGAIELLTVYNPNLVYNQSLVMPVTQLLTVYTPSIYGVFNPRVFNSGTFSTREFNADTFDERTFNEGSDFIRRLS